MSVKTLKERFEETLAAWGAAKGLKEDATKLNADGEVTLSLGEAVGTLVYRDATDTVILWLESGNYEEPETPRRALVANDRFVPTRDFTIAIDPLTDRLVVHDRRPAERLLSVPALDAWLTAGGELSAEVREIALYGVGEYVEEF